MIGTDVSFALLRAIADVPEAVLHRGLGHLQAAEFLYETRLFPEPEYTFKHALTHGVAYGSLLLERRRVLHARIVGALEALAPERVAEQIERLAHHALRGEVWAKALVYFRQAGEKAMARSAHSLAVGYFEQALSALPHLPETRDTLEQAIDLRLSLRSALFTLQPVYDGRNLDRVVLWGAGTGSGLGFSRSGAIGQAALGAKWQDIVKFYFPNQQLRDVDRPAPAPAAAKPPTKALGPYKRTLNYRGKKK